MGTVERKEGATFADRAAAARERALEAVAADELAVVLPAAMQLAGFEDDMTPLSATVERWEQKAAA